MPEISLPWWVTALTVLAGMIGTGATWCWSKYRETHKGTIDEQREIISSERANNDKLTERLNSVSGSAATEANELRSKLADAREKLAGLEAKLELLPCRDCPSKPTRPC